MFEKDEKNRKLHIYKLRKLKRMNILTAEHEVKYLKELKMQINECLKGLKSCGVRGRKEFKKVKKD